MGKGEVPPEHLWEDPKGLELWWADVEDRRAQGIYGNSGGSSSASDDHHSAPEMVENDLARALKNQ